MSLCTETRRGMEEWVAAFKLAALKISSSNTVSITIVMMLISKCCHCNNYIIVCSTVRLKEERIFNHISIELHKNASLFLSVSLQICFHIYKYICMDFMCTMYALVYRYSMSVDEFV